jgi:uncharacterized membrane protein (DUF485 family)
MNKKVNTILFILGATVFNILVAVLSFILLILFYARFLANVMPEGSHQWGLTFILLASIAVSFVVYRNLLKYMLTKVEVEKYFDPLFVRKYKKPPPKK